jgi:mersacidin/lichenicidin family type 2 lantibiotic
MKFDIIRAWKDEAYRASLSTEEQAMLPANPAGALDLSDAELEAIHGAANVNGDVSNNCSAPIQVGYAINGATPGDNSSHLSAVGNCCVRDCP